MLIKWFVAPGTLMNSLERPKQCEWTRDLECQESLDVRDFADNIKEPIKTYVRFSESAGGKTEQRVRLIKYDCQIKEDEAGE